MVGDADPAVAASTTRPGDGLFDVVSITKRNAVTVGIAKTRGPSVEAGFIEHWNGRRWSLD